MYGSPAVGAPQLGSVMTPQGRRSARIAAKKEAEEAIKEEIGGTDPLVGESIDDALNVAGFVMAGGGRRKHRGGAFGDEVKNAIKGIVTNIVDRVKRAGNKAEKDAVTAVQAINAAGSELADASGRLGRASVMATATYVAVQGLKAAGEYVPSPTWGQLGAGLGALLKTVAVDLPQIAGVAAANNPVVAVALATALTKLRAHYSGKSVADLVKQDLMTLLSKTARGITGGIQAFQDANLATKKQMLIASLPGISKNLTPGGKDYGSVSRDSILAAEDDAKLLLEVMKAMETAPEAPAPSASSSSSSAAAPSASSSSSSSAAPEAPSASSSSSTTPAPPPAPSAAPSSDYREAAAEARRKKRDAEMQEERRRELEGLDRKKPPKDGGRRKTRRGKKVKRRVTRKVTLVKFAY